MKKLSLFSLFVFVFVASYAQTVTLTFTGRDSNQYWCVVDSVVIANVTQGWQETLYYPDTVLTMQNSIGIQDAGTNSNQSLYLSQNVPNPFNGTTDVNLAVADAGVVTLEMVDENGRIVGTCHGASLGTRHGTSLQCGTHQFRVSTAAAGTYVLIARQNGKTSSIKMVCNGRGNGNAIEYAGNVGTRHGTSQVASQIASNGTSRQCVAPKSHPRGITTNPFHIGDMMEYVGYATINGEGVESEHITHTQDFSETIVLQFAVAQDGRPCPGMPTVTDIDTNIYNTVQIGNQCWMKENLRTTRYADGTPILQGDTGSYEIGYWYYPDSNFSNKSTYGLLYNWKAVMGTSSSSGANPSGVQGVCPDGWHVPSDAEWTQLTDYVSSIGPYRCSGTSTYIAKALASTEDWVEFGTPCTVGNERSTNNATGFGALPAGYYYAGYYYWGYAADYWSATATDSENAYIRYLGYGIPAVRRNSYDKIDGFSVRCVRD